MQPCREKKASHFIRNGKNNLIKTLIFVCASVLRNQKKLRCGKSSPSSSFEQSVFNVPAVEIESSSLLSILKAMSVEIVLRVDGELVVYSRMIITFSLNFLERDGGRGGFLSSFLEIRSFLIGFEGVEDDTVGSCCLMSREDGLDKVSTFDDNVEVSSLVDVKKRLSK